MGLIAIGFLDRDSENSGVFFFLFALIYLSLFYVFCLFVCFISSLVLLYWSDVTYIFIINYSKSFFFFFLVWQKGYVIILQGFFNLYV